MSQTTNKTLTSDVRDLWVHRHQGNVSHEPQVPKVDSVSISTQTSAIQSVFRGIFDRLVRLCRLGNFAGILPAIGIPPVVRVAYSERSV